MLFGMPDVGDSKDLTDIIERARLARLQPELTQEQEDIRDLLLELDRCSTVFEYMREWSRVQINSLFGEGAADVVVQIAKSGGNESDIDLALEHMLLVQEYKNED